MPDTGHSLAAKGASVVVLGMVAVTLLIKPQLQVFLGLYTDEVAAILLKSKTCANFSAKIPLPK